MAYKTANVTARVNPEIKREAEKVLEQLGIPVSVLIDSLYRQIIMQHDIQYAMTMPAVTTRDAMTAEQFDCMMDTSMKQAEAGQGRDAEAVFKA
ncbi:MAG: type II toxin-antitoxin system antitoxin, RelB/DinJ family [Clostridia bacterium]|nr:type II toxin-antitoxin system antitoxin, RelB/DinJ family [Clostridia bacterium]